MSNSRLNLTARPLAGTENPVSPGATTTIALNNGRSGLLHVPSGPVRGLVVALHGAGGQAGHALDLLRLDADRLGLVVLAPTGFGSTWAVLQRGPDVDTAAVDAALHDLFRRTPLRLGGRSGGGVLRRRLVRAHPRPGQRRPLLAGPCVQPLSQHC